MNNVTIQPFFIPASPAPPPKKPKNKKCSIQQSGVHYNPSLTSVQFFWLCSPLHSKNPDLKLKSSSTCLCMAICRERSKLRSHRTHYFISSSIFRSHWFQFQPYKKSCFPPSMLLEFYFLCVVLSTWNPTSSIQKRYVSLLPNFKTHKVNNTDRITCTDFFKKLTKKYLCQGPWIH